MPNFTRRDSLALTLGSAASLVAPVKLYAERKEPSMDALSNIRAIDYTIIFARDMPAMRAFYEGVMGFPMKRELSPSWIEYAVGSQILALTEHGMMWNDTPTPEGQLSLQLAFRVTPEEVAACAEALEAKGVRIVAPVTDQPWGHRTLFFRDPDGNLLEIYADI
ncbi:MAG: VOC family protein [Pseudooceanicola sp.]